MRWLRISGDVQNTFGTSYGVLDWHRLVCKFMIKWLCMIKVGEGRGCRKLQRWGVLRVGPRSPGRLKERKKGKGSGVL